MSLRFFPTCLFGCLMIVSIGCRRTPEAQTPDSPSSADGVKAADKGPKPGDLKKFLANAVAAKQSGNLAFEHSQLVQALTIDPTNRQGLLMLAELGQHQGELLARPLSSPHYIESAVAIHKLMETHKTLTAEERNLAGQVLYNEACTLAIDGDRARAMGVLIASFNAGFTNGFERLENDEELDALRSLPEFIAFHQAVERAMVEPVLAETTKGLFPFDFTLKDLGETTIRLDDFNEKIIVVLIWTTKSVPSLKVIPILNALTKRQADNGVSTLSIVMDEPITAAAIAEAREILKTAGSTSPCLVGDPRLQASVPDFLGYPTLLVIDRTKKVRFRINGFIGASSLDVIVQALIDEKPTGKTKSTPKK